VIFMTMQTVKRLAADIFRVGVNRIRIKPEANKDAESAMTREDVRNLIKKGNVYKIPVQGHRQKLKTRKKSGKSIGNRRGSGTINQKKEWMSKLRAQRKFLKIIVKDGALPVGEKRAIYKKVKSGIFRNKKALLIYLKENKYIKSDYAPKKPEFKKKEPKPLKTKKSVKKEGDKK